MGLCKNLIQKKESETSGKNGQVSEVELGVQRYPPKWKKMNTCPTVELGVLGAHLKKRNKMIAHGPSNKQYASKR